MHLNTIDACDPPKQIAADVDDTGGLEDAWQDKSRPVAPTLHTNQNASIVARAHPAPREGALGYTRNEQEVKALL